MSTNIAESAEQFVVEIQKDVTYLQSELRYATTYTQRERTLWTDTPQKNKKIAMSTSAPSYVHAINLRTTLLKWLDRLFTDPPVRQEITAMILGRATQTLQAVQQCLLLQEGGEKTSGFHVKYFEMMNMEEGHIGGKTRDGHCTLVTHVDSIAYGDNSFNPAELSHILKKGKGRMLLKENERVLVGYYMFRNEPGCIHIERAGIEEPYLETGAREAMAMDIIHQTLVSEPLPYNVLMLENRQKAVNPQS